MKLNCWEYMKCGREPGGVSVEVHGVCPAAIEARADGLNEGVNGGRACWGIAGTGSNENSVCIYAANIESCLKCEFYRYVCLEEGMDFISTRDIIKILAS